MISNTGGAKYIGELPAAIQSTAVPRSSGLGGESRSFSGTRAHKRSAERGWKGLESPEGPHARGRVQGTGAQRSEHPQPCTLPAGEAGGAGGGATGPARSAQPLSDAPIRYGAARYALFPLSKSVTVSGT